MSGAVEAAPPAPVESEIGKLVERIMAGETVVVRGAPNPLTGRPRRYRLSFRTDYPRLFVTYAALGGMKRRRVVNGNEWNIARREPFGRRIEQEARAMLAAIFAGIPVCDFGCGYQINSDLGNGIVDNGIVED